MEPKRSETVGERTVEGVEREAGVVHRRVDDAGRVVDRDAHEVAQGVEGGVGRVGDAARRTLEPGESVTLAPPGETEVVEVTSSTQAAPVVETTSATVVETTGPVTTGTEAGVAAGAAGRDWLSMSNDNTAAGLTSDIGNTGPIDLVVNGMRVVDANGDELGKVDAIKMGDPGAVTTQGEEYDDGDLIGDIGRAVFGGAPLPETIRNNLLRVGYVFVDGKGWLFDTDYYVAANQIARVEGDTVQLSVAKEALPTT